MIKNLDPATMSEKLRLQTEWTKSEQFLCPANTTHKLVSLDRLRCHVSTCRELKTRGPQTMVFLCQFYEGHMFLIKKERDNHEVGCRWKNLPGQPLYDAQANRHMVVHGESKKQGGQFQVHPHSQESHFQYAIRKGLVKAKDYQMTDQSDFTFVRDPNRIYLEIDQRFRIYTQSIYNHKNNLFTGCDLENYLILQDNREDNEVSEVEFPKSQYYLEMLPLSEFIQQCLSQGLPYNEHFLKNHVEFILNYCFQTIGTDLRDQYAQSLKDVLCQKSRLGFQGFIPVKFFEEVFLLNQIKDYNNYLEHLVQEVRVKPPTDKFQQDFLANVQSVTQNHPIYREQTVFINFEFQNEILIIIPRLASKVLSQYAFKQSDLLLLCFKILTKEILKQLNQYCQPSEFELTVSENLDPFLWKQKVEQQKVSNTQVIQTLGQVNPSPDEKKVKEFIQEQKLLAEIEEQDKQICTLQRRIQTKQDNILQQQKKNQQLQEQSSDVLNQLQAINQQQTTSDLKSKEEFKRLNKKLRSFKESQFKLAYQQFQDFKIQLQKEYEDKFEDQRQLEMQVNTLQSDLLRRKENVLRLQNRLSRKEKENIVLNEQLSLQTLPNRYYEGSQLHFTVKPRILCKACGKNRINTIYLPCSHALFCQTCFDELKDPDNPLCLFCNRPYTKFKHILWETGFKLGDNDQLSQ